MHKALALSKSTKKKKKKEMGITKNNKIVSDWQMG
jgi:hypothetical protein